MKWIKAKVFYTAVGDLLCADIVANLFYEMGLHGVLLDEPILFSDQGEPAHGRQAAGACSVTGYIPENKGGRDRCQKLRRRLEQLDFPARLAVEVVGDQDWNRVWKAHFKPLHVSPGLVVKPSWEKYTVDMVSTI